jgi:hypothetical protein
MHVYLPAIHDNIVIKLCHLMTAQHVNGKRLVTCYMSLTALSLR